MSLDYDQDHGDQEFINVDVVYMQYSAERDARHPDVRFDGSRMVGLAELHRQRMRTRAQRRLTDPLVYKHSNWYNEILQEELAEAPTGYQLQVFHWSIESGVREAFADADVEAAERNGGCGGKVASLCDSSPPLWLDAVSMIIGPTMEYRFGVSKHPLQGGRPRCARFERRRLPSAGAARGPTRTSDPASALAVDQYRQLLPRCPRVLDACNGCSWYFHRSCCSAAEADGHAGGGGVGGGGGGPLPDSCDESAEDDSSADAEAEGIEDELMFRITLRKFRRTKSTTYDAATGRQIRMNVRQVRPKLSTIAETV